MRSPPFGECTALMFAPPANTRIRRPQAYNCRLESLPTPRAAARSQEARVGAVVGYTLSAPLPSTPKFA
ncbi:MAG: hypothetical protein U1F35_10605 [Steroidobacteraceae bacterium]